MKKLILCLASFVLLQGVAISQNTENYDNTDFNSLFISGFFDVVISQSDEYKLQIKTDIFLKEHVKVTQNKNSLSIDLIDVENLSLNGHKGHIYISAPDFKNMDFEGVIHTECETPLKIDDLKLYISGLARVELELDIQKLDIDMEGGSHLIMDGKANSMSIDLQGAAKVESFDLECNDARVNIEGLGKANIYANENLNVNIDGIGIVNYKGNPLVNKYISLLGIVNQL